MREIKFRAWDEASNVFYEPEAVHKDGRALLKGGIRGTATAYDSPITQYTGLKDKNGTEIYEGDICETKQAVDGNFIDNIFSTYQVIYSGFSFQLDCIPKAMFTCSMALGGDTEIEVIGNIYQNPELLESK